MKRSWSEFEAYVHETMEKENIPGAAVAVAERGRVIYKKGFGYRDIAQKLAVTSETIFGIASVTKSFTAAAILELEKEGKLSVNDPVTKYIPELAIPSLEPMDEIRIHHLLSHTTGLPPVKRNENLNRLQEHVTYLNAMTHERLGKPGEYFSYSNDAFLLLGLIIERVTGRLYRRDMTQRFLDRLAMQRSTFNLEEFGKMGNVTVPYCYNKETRTYEEQVWPKLGNYAVGGGLRSNVLDLLKFGQLLLREPYFSRMWRPVHPVFRHTSYGYALTATPYGGVTLVQHGGSQPGVAANFGLVPERQLVIAVLTNASGVPAEEIWLAAANMALGRPLKQKAAVEPEYRLSTREMERFLGTYASEEGGRLDIVKEGEKVAAVIGGERYALRASGPQTLVIKAWEYPIPFYFDDSGRPWAALFGMRMLRRNKSEKA